MKVHQGKVHDYIGMVLDYSHQGEVHLTMLKHLEDFQKNFDECQAKIGNGFVVVKMKNWAKSQKT